MPSPRIHRWLPLLLLALTAGRARAQGGAEIESSLAAGFLVAYDDGAFFGEIQHAVVEGCVVEVFTASGGYIEEVRVDLRGIEDVTLATLDMSSVDANTGGAWIEISAGRARRRDEPLTRLLWTNGTPISSQKPRSVDVVPVVRFAVWGPVAEVRPKASALHRALRSAAVGCGARPS